MRQMFLRADNGQMITPRSGVQILVSGNGLLQVFITLPGKAAPQVECFLEHGSVLRLASREEAVRAAEYMLAFSGCDYHRVSESEHDDVCFVIASSPKRPKRSRPKAKPRLPAPFSEDPLVLLGYEIEDQNISAGLMVRLTQDLKVTYLWEALRRPSAELARVLGGRYWKQFAEYVTELGFEPGGPLPEGDYPWNAPKK